MQYSKHLQSSNFNFQTVQFLAKATIETVNSFRSDEYFNHVWSFVTELCEKNHYSGPKFKRREKIPSEFGGGEKNPHDDVDRKSVV